MLSRAVEDSKLHHCLTAVIAVPFRNVAVQENVLTAPSCPSSNSEDIFLQGHIAEHHGNDCRDAVMQFNVHKPRGQRRTSWGDIFLQRGRNHHFARSRMTSQAVI
jgi:hypothetical protein